MNHATTRPVRSCSAFWGPIFPLLGGHTEEETGTARFAHAWALFVFRLLFGITTLCLVFAMPVGWRYHFFDRSSVLALGNWNWFLLGVSFLLLAVCSQCAARKKSAGWLPNLVVPLYQTAVSGILFGALLDILYLSGTNIWYVHTDSGDFSGFMYYGVFGFPLIPVIFDVLLGARVRFRLAYLPFPVIIFAIWHAAYWILFGGNRGNHITINTGLFVAVHIGLAVCAVGAGIIVMVFTRMFDCCSCSEESGANDEENRQEVTS